MTDATLASSNAPTAAGFGDRGYRAYVLGALLLVYTFNFIDRVLVSVLNEPIKLAFGVSDTMMGLLGGPTFAILYTLMGIPIARLAERANRISIIAVALALWSGMTALCGFAVHFWQLLLARIGVGIGEAGCSPPAHSVISDYFPPERRASALAIYGLGVPVGSMLAAVGGGWLAQNVDWRSAFIILGLPGVILAIVFRLTVKEPPRTAHSSAPAPDFAAALKHVLGKPTFWHVAIGGALASFVGYGVGQFLNSFFMRTHGLGPFDASIYFGVVGGLSAALGTFLGGFLADRLRGRVPNALALVPAWGLIICTPLYMLGLQAGSLPLLMACLVPAAVLHYFYLGPMFATTQSIVDPRMRATAAALLLFIVNLIGYGLGPPAIGFLSDFLANAAYAGPGAFASACAGGATEPACAGARASGLQLALTIGVLGYAWAGLHYLLAARTLKRDLVA